MVHWPLQMNVQHRFSITLLCVCARGWKREAGAHYTPELASHIRVLSEISVKVFNPN